MFQKNVGTTDRIIRVVIGIGLIGFAWSSMMWWVAVVGAIVLLTGVVGWCGLYALLGISTCKIDK